MSEEGGAISSDVRQELTPPEVTPTGGQRDSRHLAGTKRYSPGHRACKTGNSRDVSSRWVNQYRQGCMWVSTLASEVIGKIYRGGPRSPTGFGKSDRPG